MEKSAGSEKPIETELELMAKERGLVMNGGNLSFQKAIAEAELLQVNQELLRVRQELHKIKLAKDQPARQVDAEIMEKLKAQPGAVITQTAPAHEDIPAPASL